MRVLLPLILLMAGSLAAHADSTPPAAPAPTVASMQATSPANSGPAADATITPLSDVSAGNSNLVLAMDRILPGATEEKIKALLPEETKAVLNLYLVGQIRQWYFRQDRPGVVFVLETGNLDNARTILAGLPLAKAHLVDYDLVPLGPYIPLATLLQNETGKKTRRH